MPEPHELRRSPAPAVVISMSAAVGGFLFGFDTAVINGAVDAVQHAFELSPFMTGLMVAVALLGSALGAWFAGLLADRYGRVPVMLVAAALFLASSLGSGLAFGAWDFVLWRAVGGVGIGLASVIGPAYIAEIAPAELRGRLGSLQQLAIVTGIFAALLSDACLAHWAGEAGAQLALGLPAWRFMFLAGALPSLAYGVLTLRIPESPRFLCARGDLQRADRVLRRVLGLRDTRAMLDEIRASLEHDQPTFADLRGASLGLKKVVWIGILLSMFQQMVGINVIFYYSTSLWRSVGFSESHSFAISVVTSIVNLLVTLVAIALIDRWGRRPLLLMGSLGMALSLFTMALCFANATQTGGATPALPAPWGSVALVAANLYVVFFGVSWGPVVWVLLGEMFPNRFRAAALAVAAAAQWGANFVVTTTFPVITSELSLSFAYGLYAALAVLSFVLVKTQIRETKGLALEQIDEQTTVAQPASV